MKHKYFAQQTELDGIKFPSKREAKRYQELKILQRTKRVVFFLRQVPFHLPGNVKYIIDFVVFWADGNITWEDTKGVKTPLYITKKKLVEALYPIKIDEV